MSLFQACTSPAPFDVQGHRGCRGLLPENSIPAFKHALELGVTTLELDVVITADQQVVVSHEPFLSHEICRDTTGTAIAEADERNWNIYTMTYAELIRFDCGSQPHPRFPNQQNMNVSKPLLRDVIATCDAFARKLGRTLPLYNIETKCTPEGDGIYHPEPERFAQLLLDEVQANDIFDRFILQSFDVRTLQYTREKYPDVPIALLVENNLPLKTNLDKLGFTPAIYSCDFTLLDTDVIKTCQQQGIRVIPWTVNEVEDMKQLLSWGVDGLITDYPDRLLNLLQTQKDRTIR